MSKTREMLVDVARQLFAKSGLENTTMNDIAIASRKGRRTLYTYFKNKNEIYWAVVESELAHLLQRLKDIANKDLPPEEKLTNYILTRLEAVKETVFRDIWKVEQARKNIDMHEVVLLKGILKEGVDRGDFRITSVSATATILHYALKGLDVPYIRDNFTEMGLERLRVKEYIADLVLYGIKK